MTRYGLLVLLLLIVESLYVPWAITVINWIDQTDLLWPVTLSGFAVGLIAGMLRPKRYRWFFAAVIGGWVYLFLVVGGAIPTLSRLTTDVTVLGHWFLSRGASAPAGTIPLFDMVRSSLTAIGTFADQLASWWRLGGAGEAAVNDRVFLFLLTLLCWTSTLYLGWAAYSGFAVFVAQLPVGAVLVTLVVLGGRGHAEVYLFLATALLLTLRVHILGLQQRWSADGLDYPSAVRGELAATGLLFTAIAGGLAFAAPAFPNNPVAVRFWEVFNTPWSALEHSVGNAFLGVRHQVGGNNGLSLRLGGPISFGNNKVVFYAVTGEAPPPNPSEHQLEDTGYVEPEHYFVGATYATYNGAGWSLGSATTASRTGVPLEPNGKPLYLGVPKGPGNVSQRAASVPIVSPSPPGSKVVQHIDLVSDPNNLLYAYNMPVATDHPYGIVQIGGWPERLTLPAGTKTYTVVSIKPEVTAQDLERDSTHYPSWIAPYLAIPHVPARVAQLAKTWAGNATNPYTKAMNIEAQLRKIPYSTNIVPPPPGHDAVDYFLFDAKRGYCEYYASAMVVMLREVGVPARIATGYATTTYDRQKAAWVISENDAHTWVQVFFPSYGWLNFEPTPVNPEIIRPNVSSGGAVVSLSFYHPRMALGIRRQWEHELSPGDYVQLVYSRLLRSGGRRGLRKRSDETPLEYGHRLALLFDLDEAEVAESVRRVTRLYTMSRYSPRKLTAADRLEVMEAWRVLRFKLWGLHRRVKEYAKLSVA
ncbi:MAG: transglutaminase domain-containing protein [Chloroflexi bacterium]|nr:transglutaminase domain-containing protein [Chloroflexota bacterium]